MEETKSRAVLIDALKIAGAQLIVLHHLAFYGPMSDIAYPLAPGLIDWLSNQARMAVQLFLVVGGFLAARSLASRSKVLAEHPLDLALRRYYRLALPLIAALGFAILSSGVARVLLPHESTPATPSLPQFLAHLLLLQNLLGFEALSAGIWYISIDFQLYVLLVGLLWLFQSRAPAAVGLLAVASLFYFNRIPVWDDWALYFFAAHAMGALAYWASKREKPLPLFVFMATVVVLALTLDFRPRIAIALSTAILLGLAYQRIRVPAAWAHRLNFLGDISYSVFLIHYPVCLLLNAIFGSVFPRDPAANAFGLLIAWSFSLLSGALFHRYIEKPSGLWLARKVSDRLAARTGTAG